MKQNSLSIQNTKIISSGAVSLLKTSKLFFIKEKKLSKNESNEIKKEIDLWKNLSALKMKPKIIPNYFGCYLEETNFNDQKLTLYMLFEQFPKTFIDLIDKSETELSYDFLNLVYFYEQFLRSLAFLQTLNICPLFLTPPKLFVNEKINTIYSYNFVYSNNLCDTLNVSTGVISIHLIHDVKLLEHVYM